MSDTDLIKTRGYIEASDKNFIYKTWLRGLYYGDDWVGEIQDSIFYPNYNDVIDEIFSRPTVQINMAVLKDDEDVILGYSVSEPLNSVLHWVFVKKSWRRIGIAKMLIDFEPSIVTHLTFVGKSLKNRYNLIFNPFLT